jgi:hypothetical protein
VSRNGFGAGRYSVAKDGLIVGSLWFVGRQLIRLGDRLLKTEVKDGGEQRVRLGR